MYFTLAVITYQVPLKVPNFEVDSFILVVLLLLCPILDKELVVCFAICSANKVEENLELG